MSYVIRTARNNDIRLMLDWAKTEGWNPGLYDYITYPAADPQGFFIGCLDNEPIASLSAVKYSSDFGFLGLYIVKPKYRGQGFGIKIWNHGIEYLKKVKIIGLDGVIEQQEHYKQSGFHLAHRNIRYSGIAPNKNSNESFIDLRSIPLESILQFEQPLFPSDRFLFLKTWIDNSHNALAYVKNNKILGYGVMRQCQQGYKIGPLFADNAFIAEQLFLALCHPIQGREVILDLPEPNKDAIKLAEQYQLKPIFETARMYSNQNPNLDLRKIFGITSFEIG